MGNQLFDRDISWLSFNERVLKEAGRESVPLLERFRFLSIYSSNLDEFYRVRIPALMALHKITKEKGKELLLKQIKDIIESQQALFGSYLQDELIPLLYKNNVALIYNQPVPPAIRQTIHDYFISEVAAFIRRIYFKGRPDFFPENNKIYFAVNLLTNNRKERAIVNIPSDALSRFYMIRYEDKQYMILLDDIVRESLPRIFPHSEVQGCWSFKITRDAELNLEDEYEGDLAEKIEKQIAKRDLGLATRILYDGSMPEKELQRLLKTLKLQNANVVTGGRYHNLKDLGNLPVNHPAWNYQEWAPIAYKKEDSLFQQMEKEDIILYPPYHSYDTVLHFFNEAVLDDEVSEIYTTLYRIASDSRIAHALISAAGNGKKVTVFVELMARFDEANNIRWAKKMKKAGVKIIYSIPEMKVHAKIALIKRNREGRSIYYGLIGTGNLNESTARIYADYILLTANKEILREMELLFLFLKKRKKPGKKDKDLNLKHLLVAQFNLHKRLLALIRYEIKQAEAGKPAAITLKLNNLEEISLIKALYRASNAGVNISLLVRGICCLVPGVEGMSKNITVHRIIGRYLEHGRIYLFHHGGEERVFIGSADWMERNIYRRIEVCTPIYDEQIKLQLKQVLQIQLADNVQAVQINDTMQNVPVLITGKAVESQFEIYKRIKT